jgi:CHRD domain-containing protein
MRSLSRRAMVLLLAVSTMSLGSLCVRPAAAETLVAFTAVLNGAQETPVPIESPSQGVALVLLVKETNKVCYRLSYSPLGGTENLAHFHGPGAPGVTAPVLVEITPAVSPIGSPKHGCVDFTKDQVKLLVKGLVYLNVHSTPLAPTGEIRGQVLPTNVKYTKVDAPASPSGAFLN